MISKVDPVELVQCVACGDETRSRVPAPLCEACEAEHARDALGAVSVVAVRRLPDGTHQVLVGHDVVRHVPDLVRALDYVASLHLHGALEP